MNPITILAWLAICVVGATVLAILIIGPIFAVEMFKRQQRIRERIAERRAEIESGVWQGFDRHADAVDREAAETERYVEKVEDSIRRGARRTDHRFKP